METEENVLRDQCVMTWDHLWMNSGIFFSIFSSGYLLDPNALRQNSNIKEFCHIK